MAKARLQERKYYQIEAQLFGPLTLVRWTTTGALGGTDLFSSSACPAFSATIESATARGQFTNAGHWGDMLVNECPTAQEQWMVEHERDVVNSHWITRVWQGGPSATGSTSVQEGRKIVLHAID